MILSEAVRYRDLHVAYLHVVDNAVLTIYGIHHSAVGTHALDRDVAQRCAVLCIKAKGGIGINRSDATNVNVLDVGAAVFAVSGTKLKRAKASLNSNVRYLHVADLSHSNTQTEAVASCVYYAVRYSGIFRVYAFILQLRFVTAYGDSVVGDVENTVGYCDVAAAVDIDSVGVEYIDRSEYLKAAHLDELASVEEERPAGSVAKRDILYGNVAAFNEDDDLPGTKILGILANGHTAPPGKSRRHLNVIDKGVAVGIYGSETGYCNVLHLVCYYEMLSYPLLKKLSEHITRHNNIVVISLWDLIFVKYNTRLDCSLTVEKPRIHKFLGLNAMKG